MLPIDDREVKIKKLLKALLNNPKFLPDGGLIGFSLSHLYPIGPKQKIDLRELGKNLKGTDAAIKCACDSLSLDVSVKTVYNSELDWVSCLLDDVADLTGFWGNDLGIFVHFQENYRGLVVFDDKKSLKEVEEESIIEDQDAKPILWLRPLAKRNPLEAPYVAYGNESTLDYIYGEICLLLKVKTYGDRQTY